jgi:small ligand-binding sensory domain FIST
MKWASSISTQAEAVAAVTEAAAGVRLGLDGQAPNLVLLFASPHYRDALVRLPSLVRERFPGARLIGCTGGGIIGAGREIEHRPALSLCAAALPGVSLHPFHFELDAAPTTPAAWHRLIDPRREPSFLLLPEPFSCDIDALLSGLDDAYPAARKVGGIASGGRGAGGNALFIDGEMLRDGVVGLALSGDIVIDTLVAQGCRPIGTPLIITRCEDNTILELSGQPALPVLRSLFETLDGRDRELFRHALFLGIQMKDDQLEYRQGDFLIRNLLGINPDRNAVVVASAVEPYQAVQFHLRDAEASAEDLRQHLLDYARRGHKPAGALLFSCLGRGENLYGQPDHDSNLVINYLGSLPLCGFFCNGEIGPVGDTTFLHGYTSSFALMRPR